MRRERALGVQLTERNKCCMHAQLCYLGYFLASARGRRFVLQNARVRPAGRHPPQLEAPMKRTGSRQRARESIVRMIAKIQRLEAGHHPGQPRITERLKGMAGAIFKAPQGAESTQRLQQGR